MRNLKGTEHFEELCLHETITLLAFIKMVMNLQ